MENENNKATIDSFLSHRKTEDLFAELDYQLKDGVHFQQVGKQNDYYDYIVDNEDSLKLYYKIFKVDLTFGGEEPYKYYFLDFSGTNRKNISNRHILKNEYVIIGFIIYEIFFINREVDLNSVQKLKEKIRIDYEDIKPGLYRLIAKSKNTNPGNLNDKTIDLTINAALSEFKKIGWITLNNGEFDLLPAFDRLIKIYEKDILNIDEILNELK